MVAPLPGFAQTSPMLYRLLADGVVIVHLGFVLFVLFGGILALWWPRVVWLHLPAAAWGAAVEFGGWTCPLTPLEYWLRLESGTPGDRSDFIETYVLPMLYPAGLTHDLQLVLGALVVVINFGIYGWLLRRTGRSQIQAPSRRATEKQNPI